MRLHSSSGSARRARLLRLPEQPLARHLLLAVAAGALLYWLTLLVSPYDNTELAEIGWYVIAIAGLSLLTGVSGQISLGQGAFMAIGAYAAGLMMEHYDLPLIVPIVVGVAVAAAFGVLVGMPATRLRGPYLAGVTLALALAVQDLPEKSEPVQRGPGDHREPSDLALLGGPGKVAGVDHPYRGARDDGRAGEPHAKPLRAVAQSRTRRRGGGFGRGLNPARLRVLAFAMSAAAAGLAGGLFALWSGIVSPDSFGLFLSIQLLAGMVIGGSGTLVGAWWGALGLVFVPQWTTSLAGHLNLSSGVSANLQNAVFGLLIVVIMMVAPSGIQGWLRSLASQLRHWARHHPLLPQDPPSLAGPASVATSSSPTPSPERTIP